MNENQQITYMQARVARLASEEWNMSIQTVMSMFTEFDVLRFIRECFGIFHVESDYAVLDDIVDYLGNKGVKIHEKTN
jgi:hypothetical protein